MAKRIKAVSTEAEDVEVTKTERQMIHDYKVAHPEIDWAQNGIAIMSYPNEDKPDEIIVLPNDLIEEVFGGEDL